MPDRRYIVILYDRIETMQDPWNVRVRDMKVVIREFPFFVAFNLA
jgi:hypothetical protein